MSRRPPPVLFEGATGAGSVIGAVVSSARRLAAVDLHAIAARALPASLRPSRVAVLRTLPRLRGGKVDRRACLAALEGASGARLSRRPLPPPAAHVR